MRNATSRQDVLGFFLIEFGLRVLLRVFAGFVEGRDLRGIWGNTKNTKYEMMSQWMGFLVFLSSLSGSGEGSSVEYSGILETHACHNMEKFVRLYFVYYQMFCPDLPRGGKLDWILKIQKRKVALRHIGFCVLCFMCVFKYFSQVCPIPEYAQNTKSCSNTWVGFLNFVYCIFSSTLPSF